MSTIFLVVLAVVALFAASQIVVVWRARSLRGKQLGELPGATGGRIGRSERALVYFFSPTCAACRALTPRVRELARHNDAVFAVDVMKDMALARALGVMATPSTIEIERGKIVGYYVGKLPAPVEQRFARA